MTASTSTHYTIPRLTSGNSGVNNWLKSRQRIRADKRIRHLLERSLLKPLPMESGSDFLFHHYFIEHWYAFLVQRIGTEILTIRPLNAT